MFTLGSMLLIVLIQQALRALNEIIATYSLAYCYEFKILNKQYKFESFFRPNKNRDLQFKKNSFTFKIIIYKSLIPRILHVGLKWIILGGKKFH